MSFDPVATNTVALRLCWMRGPLAPKASCRTRSSVAPPCLENAVKLGLGTNDLDNMDVVETELR